MQLVKESWWSSIKIPTYVSFCLSLLTHGLNNKTRQRLCKINLQFLWSILKITLHMINCNVIISMLHHHVPYMKAYRNSKLVYWESARKLTYSLDLGIFIQICQFKWCVRMSRQWCFKKKVLLQLEVTWSHPSWISLLGGNDVQKWKEQVKIS